MNTHEDKQTLIPLDELEEVAGATAQDLITYSAERLARNEPYKYKAISALLSEGVPAIAIARSLNVHQSTVSAIMKRECTREEYTKRTTNQLMMNITRLSEEITRRLEDPERASQIPDKEIPKWLEGMHRVAQSLEGLPSEYVGVINPEGALNEVRDLLRQRAQEIVIKPDTTE